MTDILSKLEVPIPSWSEQEPEPELCEDCAYSDDCPRPMYDDPTPPVLACAYYRELPF